MNKKNVGTKYYIVSEKRIAQCEKKKKYVQLAEEIIKSEIDIISALSPKYVHSYFVSGRRPHICHEVYIYSSSTFVFPWYCKCHSTWHKEWIHNSKKIICINLEWQCSTFLYVRVGVFCVHADICMIFWCFFCQHKNEIQRCMLVYVRRDDRVPTLE